MVDPSCPPHLTHNVDLSSLSDMKQVEQMQVKPFEFKYEMGTMVMVSCTVHADFSQCWITVKALCFADPKWPLSAKDTKGHAVRGFYELAQDMFRLLPGILGIETNQIEGDWVLDEYTPLNFKAKDIGKRGLKRKANIFTL